MKGICAMLTMITLCFLAVIILPREIKIEYTENDLTICGMVAVGTLKCDQNMLDRYDMNDDGKITALDIVGIQRNLKNLDKTYMLVGLWGNYKIVHK